MRSRLLSAVRTCVFTFTGITTVQGAPVSGQGTWEATLQGRDLDGNAATFEAYYDTVLDISWLSDVNYAQTSGFDDDGRMTWASAKAWAAALNVNGVTGWRLPMVSPVNGMTFDVMLSTDGSTDRGYTSTTTDGSDGGWRDSSNIPVSEMGHMYYVHLGNLGLCDPSLPYCTEQSGRGLSNTGPFTNLPSSIHLHWSATEFAPTEAWIFNVIDGFQGIGRTGSEGLELIAWAVRDGDVSAVPVPAAIWLFGSGVLGLIGMARRKVT